MSLEMLNERRYVNKINFINLCVLQENFKLNVWLTFVAYIIFPFHIFNLSAAEYVEYMIFICCFSFFTITYYVFFLLYKLLIIAFPELPSCLW